MGHRPPAAPTTIFVRRGGGGFEKVRWWGPASPDAIRRALLGFADKDSEEEAWTLWDVSTGAQRTLGELDRGADGAMFRVAPTSTHWATRLFRATSSLLSSAAPVTRHELSSKNGWQDPRFQGQLLKYERVLSHLASERTLLAWIRCALTLLAQGVALWAASHRLNSLQPYLVATALAYFAVVPATVAISLRRWLQTKCVLASRSVDVERDFGAMHVHLQAGLLLVICILAALTFAVLGSTEAIFPNFRPTNFFE